MTAVPSGEGLVSLGRRVGEPARYRVVALYFSSALLCWVAGTFALVRAAPELAHGCFDAPHVLFAVHLVGLGFLPFAVAGGALHILPVLLRNGSPDLRARLALPLHWSGPLLAYGISTHDQAVAYPAAGVMSIAVALLAAEVVLLVVRAPRRRVVPASRFGISLSATHALLAFVLGAVVLGVRRDLTEAHESQLIAIHLNLAVLGWPTLLILTVGRTLGPMLAGAPAEGERRLPVDELLLVAGLWLVIAGLATGIVVAALGAALVLVVLVRLGLLLDRVRRGQRLRGFEGPIAHFLAGLVFLAQAVLTGLWLLAAGSSGRLDELYVLCLLGGWAAGVTLGHLGKLLSLSAWTWWPRGPRPSQAEIYPRRAWLVEAALFVVGVELLADGILARSEVVSYAGSALVAAVTAALAAVATLRATRPALTADALV